MKRRGRTGYKTIGDYDFTDTKEKFHIVLDTENGEFSICLGEKYNRQTFKGKDLTLVKNEAFRFLKDITAANWKPFIHVEFDDTFSSSGTERHKIFLKYDRFFVAIRPNGEKAFRMCHNFNDGLEPGQNTYERDEGKHSRLIPHTEEAWQGLQKISEMIDALNDRIKEFVGRPDLSAKLAEVYLKPSSLLLEGPKGKEKATS